MKLGRQIASVLAASALLCAAAEAQTRTRVIGPAGTRVVRTSAATTASLTGVGTAGTGSVIADVSLSSLPAPGLGFDSAHVAALNRNAGVRALIDPVTQHRLALERQIRREAPPVAPLVPFFPSVQVVIVQQPPVVILQEEEEKPAEGVTLVAGPPMAPRSEAEARQEPAARSGTEEPAPELSELVLVLKNGKLQFVAAFSVMEERLVLVTREGVRRTLARDEVDWEATISLNQERGINLRL